MFRFFKILVFIVVLINNLTVSSQAVSRKVMDEVANTFMAENFPGGTRKINSVIPFLYEKQNSINLLELEPEGWILISADRKVEPIIGFSFTGHFTNPDENRNSPMYNWFKLYQRQIKQIVADESLRGHGAWDMELKSGSLDGTSASSVKVEPFMEAKWDQGRNWNQFCPSDVDGPGGHVYVGCVAVSMAQAMSVFKNPAKGIGTYSYLHPVYGTQFANFGNTYYNWDSMAYVKADKYNSLLLYHCAVAVNMDFGPDGSGTQTLYSAAALRNYFLYSQNILYKKRTGSDTEWHNQLHEQLLNGRPIIYSGDAGDGKPGHAFNIDGVTNSIYYHLNWGWSGSNNGYYILDNLNPGSFNFSENQAAVLGIQPKYYPTDIILSDTIVKTGQPQGTLIGTIDVIDEATDNLYVFELSCDSAYNGSIWEQNYFLSGDSLKTGRVFAGNDAYTDTITINLKDQYNNTLSKKMVLHVGSSLTGFPLTEVDKNNYFILYPNPATDHLFIVNKEQINIQSIRVFSISGTLIKNISNPDLEKGIQINSLLPGLYIIEAQLENNRLVHMRFVKH